MFGKKFFCLVLALQLIIGSVCGSVNAVEIEQNTPNGILWKNASPRATESFSINIPSKTQLSANTTFPLAAGETVTIKASYSPFASSADFGLIAPNGVYYYFNITNGSIDKTIKVSMSGDYTFQIRNNSNVEVKVTGFVNY